MFESSNTAFTICHNIKELQFATYCIYVLIWQSLPYRLQV